MKDKINEYLEDVFSAYNGVKSVFELKEDLRQDLQERYMDLKGQGMDDTTAFAQTIDSIGDIEQTVLDIANLSGTLERQLVVNFSAKDLQGSDFAKTKVSSGKFEASNLADADFSNADLSGSSFKSSDVSNANFDDANLTDCVLTVVNLCGSKFNRTKLVRTSFSKSDLSKAVFKDVQLVDVNLSMTQLTDAVFENCVFDGVNFNYGDLRGLKLENQTFKNMKFSKVALDNASFRGSTFLNVSFTPPPTIFNKYYRGIKSIDFEGAVMDKLTYNALKGMGVDVSKITVI